MIPICLPDIAPDSRCPVPGPTTPAGRAGDAPFIMEISEALSRAVAAMLTCQEGSGARSSRAASALAGFFAADGEVAFVSATPGGLLAEAPTQGESKAKPAGEGESEESPIAALASAGGLLLPVLPPVPPPQAAALALPAAPVPAQAPPGSDPVALTPAVPGQVAPPPAGGGGTLGGEVGQATDLPGGAAGLQAAEPGVGQSAEETRRADAPAQAPLASTPSGAEGSPVGTSAPAGRGGGASAPLEDEGAPLSAAAGQAGDISDVALGPRPAPTAPVPSPAAESVPASILEADGLPRATRADGETVVPRFVSGPRESEFVAMLEPKDLGQLGVRVVLREGALRVSFAAERPEATQLIQNHLPELRQSLEEQGLRLSGLGLERDGLAWSLLGDGRQQRYREGHFGPSGPVEPRGEAGQAPALSRPGIRATDGARGLDVLV